MIAHGGIVLTAPAAVVMPREKYEPSFETDVVEHEERQRAGVKTVERSVPSRLRDSAGATAASAAAGTATAQEGTEGGGGGPPVVGRTSPVKTTISSSGISRASR